MEFAPTRRKAQTYGKGVRRNMVPDLFDVTSSSNNVRRNSPARKPHAALQKSLDRDSQRQLKDELNFAANNLDNSKSTPSSDLPSTPKSIESTPSPSLFEIQSSEDETKILGSPDTARKRRKLLSQSLGPPAQGISDKSIHIEKIDHKQPFSGTLQSSNTNMPIKRPGKVLTQDSRISAESEGEVQKPKLKSAFKSRSVGIDRETASDTNLPISRKAGTSRHGTATSKMNQSKPLKSPVSDRSARSSASGRSTPKRKRDSLGDHVGNISSPSQLELASLRFTPDGTVKERFWSFDMDDSDSSETSAQRARHRLVDKLDNPSRNESPSGLGVHGISTSAPKPKTSTTGLPLRNAPIQSRDDTNKQSGPPIERSSSAQSGSSMGRTRVTYGKQRSHLSDMVDSLEESSHVSSQQSRHQTASQAEQMAHVDSQFDYEIQDDDDQPTNQLKSIHELRQAGAVNRFDRDLDAVFEDIEAESKALRLQGLMLLVRKLQEQAFKRHLLDSGRLHRLTDCSRSDLDLPSAVVLLLALWTLAVSEAASGKCYSQICRALFHLPPSVLREGRSLSSIARDRKEKLSTALVQDLMEFEVHVLQKSVKGGRQTSFIISARVALRCFEFTLRRVAELGESIPKPSNEIVTNMLLVMEEHATALTTTVDRVEHIESIRLLLSWFELISSGFRQDDCTLSSTQYRDLGRNLAEVIGWARIGQATIEQSCLRVVVSWSNGNSRICQQFGTSKILKEILSIVEFQFLRLAENASQEKEVDADKLDAVILALGCLLNFAECSEDARQQMLESDQQGKSHIDKLVNIFNRYVDDTSEAVTFDQSQVMVAFGYLAMLLCTLCLDPGIRSELANKIKGEKLVELFKAVETFLSYMKAVEMTSESEEGSDAFTARFSTILEKAKTTSEA